MTINVNDVNDKPKVSGPAEVTYSGERAHVAVGTYTATDQDGDAVTWSVSGRRRAVISISTRNSGELTFKLEAQLRES